MTEATNDRQRRWNERMPPDRAWKPRAGMNREARAAEQDRAAGGRHTRAVDVGEGRYARASVALRLYRSTRRIRAYLRWSQSGETRERYVGEVDAETRAANLAQAWVMARTAGYVTPETVPPGSWASSPGLPRGHVREQGAGHETGACPTFRSIPQGTPLSRLGEAYRGPSAYGRRRIHQSQSGCVRRRLLLARLPRALSTRDQASRILASEDRRESGPRRRHERGAERAGVDCRADLGTRRSGDGS